MLIGGIIYITKNHKKESLIIIRDLSYKESLNKKDLMV